MDIRHRIVDDALWVEVFVHDVVVGSVKFLMYLDDNLRSASTLVLPSYRGAKLATQMYMHAFNLGYKIQPSKLQSDEGKLMWNAFRKANLPFVQPTKWQRFKKVMGSFTDKLLLLSPARDCTHRVGGVNDQRTVVSRSE